MEDEKRYDEEGKTERKQGGKWTASDVRKKK